MTNIHLDPIAPRHADAVQALASHPDVLATTNLPEPYPEDGAMRWIEAVQPRREAGEEYPFAIVSADDVLVGVTGLVDVTPDVGEIGFWIGKPYWNRGHATAAGRLLLKFAFEGLELEEVFARPLKRNIPSRRVLDKLGFTAVSVETHEHPKWTDDDLVVRYELTRSEWRAHERAEASDAHSKLGSSPEEA